MIGSYVLTFQVYLALPLAAGDALGAHATKVTSGLFVVAAAARGRRATAADGPRAKARSEPRTSP
ncbi:Putative ABC transport system membrane protein OS=Streptomyces microflavus OX=1919 GN=Smic_07980 PE=4 SV=1 [Streptomyces microflavus]